VITVRYRQDKNRSDFLGSAGDEYCVSRKLKYFGYKLVLLSTLDGIPGIFELVPANTDERAVVDEVLDKLLPGLLGVGDKEFIREDWQRTWLEINILTQYRENQKDQLLKSVTKWMNGLRELIEEIYKITKEGGRSIEHKLAHTVEGMASQILAKITELTLRKYLRNFLGIDVLTYQRAC
jgi:Transposase DDE domain